MTTNRDGGTSAVRIEGGVRRSRTIEVPSESARAAHELMLALDPALGVIDALTELPTSAPDLPRVVRARLPERGDGVVREVHGRGATANDALVSAVSTGFEHHGLAELARKGGHVQATVVDTGARVLVDARRVIARCGLGCAADLVGAVEHATLEACDRRALVQALAAGRFAARIDERPAPPAVARVLEWHRGRGCQVRSVLVDRGPPVVACFAVPAASNEAVVIGIAAARTCTEAWRSAAMELHQVFVARARHDRVADLRPGGAAAELGEVVAIDRAIATDRATLMRTLDDTRGLVDPGAVPPWSRSIHSVAVELTTAAAARFGRRVVAVVVGDSPERGPLTLV